MNIKYQLKGHEYLGLNDKEYYTRFAESCRMNQKWVDNNLIEIDLHSDEYILRNIPVEFHKALKWMAYEQGHAYGDDEIRNYLVGYAGDLEDSIKQFEERIRDEASQP